MLKHSRSILAGAVAAAGIMLTPLYAADHAESPGVDADPAADFGDVYVFRAPDRPANTRLVGAFTFGNRPAPRTRIDVGVYCDRNILYTLNIDTNNDNLPNHVIHARVDRDPRGNCGLQIEGAPGAGAATFSGPEGVVFTSPTGLRAFIGLGDDPFFFDAQGFNATVATFTPGDANDPPTCPPPIAPGPACRLRFSGGANNGTNDSFGFRNVTFIVFEMDLTAIPLAPGGVLRVWGTTSRIPG